MSVLSAVVFFSPWRRLLAVSGHGHQYLLSIAAPHFPSAPSMTGQWLRQSRGSAFLFILYIFRNQMMADGYVVYC